MTITYESLRKAVNLVIDVDGVEMRPELLVEDIVALAKIFDDEKRFFTAIDQTISELKMLANGRRTGTPLSQNHLHIFSLHYQSRRINGQKADLRLAYDEDTAPHLVRLFGHRHLPISFYKRLETRKTWEPI